MDLRHRIWIRAVNDQCNVCLRNKHTQTKPVSYAIHVYHTKNIKLSSIMQRIENGSKNMKSEHNRTHEQFYKETKATIDMSAGIEAQIAKANSSFDRLLKE